MSKHDRKSLTTAQRAAIRHEANPYPLIELLKLYENSGFAVRSIEITPRGHEACFAVGGEEPLTSQDLKDAWLELRRAVYPKPLPASSGRKQIPMRMRSAVLQRDKGICAYCGDRTDHPHIDHIVPRSRGGENSMDNLTVACQTCNQSKGSKTPEEWRAAVS